MMAWGASSVSASALPIPNANLSIPHPGMRGTPTHLISQDDVSVLAPAVHHPVEPVQLVVTQGQLPICSAVQHSAKTESKLMQGRLPWHAFECRCCAEAPTNPCITKAFAMQGRMALSLENTTDELLLAAM
jgi:hypothetical protein